MAKKDLEIWDAFTEWGQNNRLELLLQIKINWFDLMVSLSQGHRTRSRDRFCLPVLSGPIPTVVRRDLTGGSHPDPNRWSKSSEFVWVLIIGDWWKEEKKSKGRSQCDRTAFHYKGTVKPFGRSLHPAVRDCNYKLTDCRGQATTQNVPPYSSPISRPLATSSLVTFK